MIAIAGKAGTGKTTLADILVDRLGYPWRRESFAGPLKAECRDIFGLLPDVMHTEDGKRMQILVEPEKLQFLGIISAEPELLQVRRILQLRGQYCRKKDPDYWVKAFDAEHGGHHHVIIDDVRYPNELEYAKSENAYCVRLLPFPGWERGLHAMHESETALDYSDGFDLMFRPAYGDLSFVARHIVEELHGRNGR